MASLRATLLAFAGVFLAACGGDDAHTDVGALEPLSTLVCSANDSLPCETLAGAWAAGTATCRADGRGWDVSACILDTPGQAETVKPAERSARYAAARCNDGTPFAMRVRLAPKPSPVWSIYLEGGVYCDDVSFRCADRDKTLTTTLPADDGNVDVFDGGGIFNTDATRNPDFFDKNQVLAHYCSSDFWAGATSDRRPSSADPTHGWYFSGHAIVDALFAILVERYGLDDADPALRVLFGGGSAGAWGAHLNQSRVLSALPNAAKAGRVAVLVDAGWMTDWTDPSHELGGAKLPDAEVWRGARDFWAATFDPDCENAAVAAGKAPSTCFTAPGWYPFVAGRGPVIVQQCSFDASFTQLHNLAPTDPAAAAWRAQVLASFPGVTWLFSGGTPSYHAIAGVDGPLGTEPNGVTFLDVLHSFWNGAPPVRLIF